MKKQMLLSLMLTVSILSAFAKYALHEGFEDSAFPPSGWTMNSVDKVTSDITPNSGASYVRMDADADFMISPLLPHPCKITYYHKKHAGNYRFLVEYASNINGPWTAFPGYPMFAGRNWMMKTINLSGLTNVYVRWMPYSPLPDAKTFYFDNVTFFMKDRTVPVELSMFTASYAQQTDQQQLVKLIWITQSESKVAGYNLYRSDDNSLSTAVKINPDMIEAHNTSLQTSYSFKDEGLHPATWYYWLENNGLDGKSEYFGPISITITNGTKKYLPEPPFSISKLSPNPFNPEITVIAGSYSLEKAGHVKINIFNIKGQKVRTLVDSERDAGYHNEIRWNGKDDNDRPCKSGMYYLTMTAENFSITRKIAIIN